MCGLFSGMGSGSGICAVWVPVSDRRPAPVSVPALEPCPRGYNVPACARPLTPFPLSKTKSRFRKPVPKSKLYCTKKTKIAVKDKKGLDK